MILNFVQQNIKQITNLERSLLLRLILCGVAVLFLCWFSWLSQFAKPHAFSHELYYWAGLTLTTPILYFAGLPFLRALTFSHPARFSIDIPIIISLLIIYGYSLFNTLNYDEDATAYFDSILMILFIILSCRFLEVFCLRRIKKTVNNLSKLPAHQVKLLKADDQFHTCFLQDIVAGDKLTIAPGEYFPVDGIIQEGDTNVDESMITGEAHCVAKFKHDCIKAGTRNMDKAVLICATSSFQDSYFGNLLFSMQINYKKSSLKPPCDQVGLWQQMIMVTMSAIIFCWWLPFDMHFALQCAITFLLITCPCAIAIAFPITTACLLEVCAKKGILVTNPLAFYKLNDVEHMLFDKTGTLTEGNLIVESIEKFKY
ncbi:MAG: HAD-IC family P-type ATPase [Candidatus Berkiella sp.]